MGLIERDDEYDPIVMAFDAAEEHGANVAFAREEYATACAIIESLRQQLRGAVEALERICDHGKTHDEPCWAITNGDCADVMQEIARATLDRLGGQ